MPDFFRSTASYTFLKDSIDLMSGGSVTLSLPERQMVSANPRFLEMTAYSFEELSILLQTRSDALVFPEDRDFVETEARSQIAEKGCADLEFRLVKKSGSLMWVRLFCGYSEDEERRIRCILLDSSVRKNPMAHSKHTKKETFMERRLIRLTNNIPGGVAHLLAGSDLRVLYASDGFYQLSGNTREEYMNPDGEIRGRASHILYEEDFARIGAEVAEFLASGAKSRCFEYRICHKSGSLRWVRAKVMCPNGTQGGISTLEGVFIDVTEEVEIRHQLEVAQKRYRIITDYTQDIIFEWDLEQNKLYTAPMFEHKFGYPLPPDALPLDLVEMGIIHPGDAEVVRQTVEATLNGAPSMELEYRIRKSDGSYLWCRNRATAIHDEERRLTSLVGIITDIDEEKRRTDLLKKHAQTDMMTGLLNKMTTQSRVAEALVNSQKDARHVMYLLDIDNFKGINDKRGHMEGDRVLTEISALLLSHFREEDIVGRIGGDEFLIFVEDVCDDGLITQRAGLLTGLFRRFAEKWPEYRGVSGSIGIAKFPEHGTTFRELYENADMALYRAKDMGKDCFCLCSDRNGEVCPQETRGCAPPGEA